MNRIAHRFATLVATLAFSACSGTLSSSPRTAPAASAASPYVEFSPARSSQQPAERPGLGTAWGETRWAPVHDVAFERGSDHPFSVVAVHYNDREGAGAMASREAERSGVSGGGIPVRSGLRVSVLDEDGAPLSAYASAGRVFVIGEAGRRYRLMVQNQTSHRLEAVISVDGLDVIDGSAARLDKRGYLVEAGSTITIDGFRKSDTEVAAFRFSSVRGSYAAQTAGDADVGVIGWAFYDERGATAWDDAELDRRLGAQPFSDSRYAQPPRGAR